MASLLTVMKSAGNEVVKFLNESGTTCIYTPKGGAPITLKAYVRELGVEELVGDYRQGDLRIEIDATKIPDRPNKYDTISIGGKVYGLKDPNGSPRRVGDTIYTYKFIVRGA